MLAYDLVVVESLLGDYGSLSVFAMLLLWVELWTLRAEFSGRQG